MAKLNQFARVVKSTARAVSRRKPKKPSQRAKIARYNRLVKQGKDAEANAIADRDFRKSHPVLSGYRKSKTKKRQPRITPRRRNGYEAVNPELPKQFRRKPRKLLSRNTSGSRNVSPTSNRGYTKELIKRKDRKENKYVPYLLAAMGGHGVQETVEASEEHKFKDRIKTNKATIKKLKNKNKLKGRKK